VSSACHPLRDSLLQTIRFYINETRRSLSHFQDVVDEDIWLIYNDKVVFSGRHIHKDVSSWSAPSLNLPDSALSMLSCNATMSIACRAAPGPTLCMAGTQT